MRPEPGVYPRDQPRSTSSQAEVEVWKALRKGLPAGWYAWHSLRLRDSRASHAEGDFVLAHPDRGVLIVEVKGGRLELQGGHWLQNGKPLKEAPLTQAHRFRNALLNRFRELKVYAPAVGQATCFPAHEFDNQPSADDVAGIVLGPSHLRWLEQSLPAVFDRAVPPARHTDGAWLEAIHAMWCERWVPAVSLGGRAQEELNRRLALDEAQLEALEGMLENERVLVQGSAGSGKTVIAAEAARRLAAEGRRVLLLCFTTPLRRFLEQRMNGTGVDVQTINGFAKQVEVQIGPTPGDPDLHCDGGWAALFRHVVPYVEPRWDAVVVDEAQDLQPGAWALVKRLAAGKRLWAFHDAGQKFWLGRQLPEELFTTRYRLLRQQRSPPGIFALAQRALGLEFDAAALAAARAEGLIRIIVSPREAAAVGTEVDRLLAGGLHPGDIGVVSLRGTAARNAPDRESVRFGPHEAVRADAEDACSRLVADTFLRWKGLERAAMIVTNLPAGPLSQLPLRLNIALTRATVAVSLVGTAEALHRVELDKR